MKSMKLYKTAKMVWYGVNKYSLLTAAKQPGYIQSMYPTKCALKHQDTRFQMPIVSFEAPASASDKIGFA